MRRRNNCRGLTFAIILGLACHCWVATAEDAQETTNLTITDEQSSSPSDTAVVSVTDQLTRRADENQRSMSFSGDADFEARRPRGLLAALFGYPDEFENNESPAMDSGYGIQEDNNYRGRGGTPPPRFKASHYYTTSKKPTFLSKTTTIPITTPIPSTTTLRSSAKISEEDSLDEKSNNASDAARNISSESRQMRTSSNNETDFLDSDIESEEYIGGSSGGDDDVNNATSSTEGSAGNKREVSTGDSMRRGRQSQAVQARPLPAGYILWHPVPASFLRGHLEGGGGGGSLGSMALSSDMSKQQMLAGRFIPHRPFFVEPNINGASLNRIPFPPMTSPSDNGGNADSLGPREHKAATKLHRQMERERNRERKKKAKKERQKSKDQQQESVDDNDEPSDGQNEQAHDGQNNNNQQPLHMMLPPLPMNGFPDGPFSTNEQRPFQEQRPLQGPRPLEEHLQRPPPPPPPINFNRDFPAPQPPNQGPPRPQRPFMNEHVHQDNVPFPGELNVQRRPPPPDNIAFKNHDNGPPIHFNNRPFDNNNRPFEPNNNHRVFDSMGPFENHGGHHEGPMRFRERRPSPSPSAHPVKFEIDHHERMREMEEHQFQRGPLGPLPPPPGPHFPPPRFPTPFNDQRPFPDLPPPPPPPPLGPASSRDKHDNNNNGHHHDRFRDSSSPPTQHLDVHQNFNNLQVPTPDQGGFRGHQPSPPPLPSKLPPFVDATAPSAFHSSAADLLPFGHSSQSPSSTPPSAFPSSSTQQPPSADANFGIGQHQQNFNSFSGPPPLPATFAPHPGLNLNDQQHDEIRHEQQEEEQEEDNNGFIYSRDFKKSLAEANIVLPNSNQNFGVAKIDSRSSSTTLAPSTFGLPLTVPHRPPRPEIMMTTSEAVQRQQQQQQQPFTEHSEKPHPHQVSPAASHRLPQAANNNPHPNLPDFRPTGPTTVRPDMRVDTTTYEPQRDQNVQRSSDAPAPQRSRENYKSPGFHTGHKGYPSSVTAPNNNNNNQVTSSEELATLYTVVTRASPTSKSNVEVDVQSQSSTTPAAYGYVRHTQSSRNQPSASFSYEIKYQSPAPPSSPVSSRVTNAISSTTFRPEKQSSSSSSSPSASGPFRPRLWPPHRRMRTGGPDSRRPQQQRPDIV